MGEVLSQNEIDNLLAALSAGDLDVDQMQGKEEILKEVQDLFQSDFIYKIAISNIKFG